MTIEHCPIRNADGERCAGILELSSTSYAGSGQHSENFQCSSCKNLLIRSWFWKVNIDGRWQSIEASSVDDRELLHDQALCIAERAIKIVLKLREHAAILWLGLETRYAKDAEREIRVAMKRLAAIVPEELR